MRPLHFYVLVARRLELPLRGRAAGDAGRREADASCSREEVEVWSYVALRLRSVELSHHARHFRNARRRGEGGAETVGGKSGSRRAQGRTVVEALYRT